MGNRAAVALAASLISLGAAAQPARDPINRNEMNNGANVRAMLAAFERLSGKHPEYGEELKRLRGGIGLVFVPGILGSKLKSKSVGEIWGFGVPDAGRLALPESLVDHAAESDVTAELAEEVAGISLYGEAMKKIRANAPAAGVSADRIEACGYDWRRDIRAGAAELARCVDASPKLKGISALVVVAHSMGGLVTWQWLKSAAKDGRLPNGVPVIAVAVLGSPLAGSCEIIRMVEKGYEQPVADQDYVRRSVFGNVFTAIAGMRDRFVNAFTSLASDGIRPLVLSWPGAVSLSLRPADSIWDPNCALVPLEGPTSSKILNHYNPEFWTRPIGIGLLNGAKLPGSYVKVLGASAQFRNGFAVTTLDSPTYIYASQLWRTPTSAPVDSSADYRLGAGGWNFDAGDGRVPFTSARPRGVEPADVSHLASVHGNLPEDEYFHAHFFGDRLRRVANVWLAARMLDKAKADAAFLASYVAAKAPYPVSSDFAASYEVARAGLKAVYPAFTSSAESSAAGFKDALCAVSRCPDYAEAKEKAAIIRQADRPDKDRALANLWTASLRGSRTDEIQRGFITAQRGLSLAKEVNWAAALRDLRIADEFLEDRHKRLGAGTSDAEKELRLAVKANLGKALVLRGFCEEASAPISVAAAGDQKIAKGLLGAQCFDLDSGKVATVARR